MPRPRHEPTAVTRKQVETYAACGTPEHDIALKLGIDPKTLRKYYRRELDSGHIDANAKVAQTLFKVATSGKAGPGVVTAMIFWLKVRAGWKEADRLEIVGEDGAPIKSEQTVLVEFVGPKGDVNDDDPDPAAADDDPDPDEDGEQAA